MLLVMLAIGVAVICGAELLCSILDLPRVHATRDEYDEVQS